MISRENEGPEFKRCRRSCPCLDCMETLVKYRANMNVEDDSGRTPLILSVERNNQSAISMLVEKGAGINYKSAEGSALHFAVCASNIETIKLLLKLGADPNAPDRWELTPLHKAIEKNRKDVVELLLDHNADPHYRGYNCTPLDVAAFSGNIEIFDIFKRRQIKIVFENFITGALLKNNEDLVVWLLENGVDPNFRGDGQRTPLHNAAIVSNLRLVKKIMEKGGELNAEDSHHNTPYSLAISHNNKEVADYLKSLGAI